jgi:penicillin amidase
VSKLIKVLLVLAGVIIVLGLILFGAWTLFSRQALPKTDGTVEVTGLSQPVEILRDEYGVAHIYAQSPEDLFFAQGYVHAQDRFWQMEFQRRLGAGRMSELFGETSLSTDRYLRHFDFHDVAAKSYDLIDQETRDMLDAYAAGVNAYIGERRPGQLGLEFALLELQGVDVEIEPWTPADSLSWGQMLMFDQANQWNIELGNIDRLASVGLDMYADLFGEYRDDRPVVIAAADVLNQSTVGAPYVGALGAAELDYLLAVSAGLEGVDGLPQKLADLGFLGSAGSNSIAISGDLTDTGMPILANDPHMRINMPSLWYENGLHCVEKSEACLYDLRGVSLPGVPSIVIGHNDRIAWGLTNAAFDPEDVFVERINPDNPNQYEVNGEWQEMEIRQEEIEVRGREEPEVMFVRSTRNGMVITDELVDPRLNWSASDGAELFALAYKWTALEPVRSVMGVAKANKAQNWDEFVDALQYFEAGQQNWLYADVEGNIGYVLPGKIPIRAAGDGTLPVPGWNDDYQWQGFIPYEDMPKTFNPENGYIVTANNPQVREESYSYLIGRYHDRGQRAGRITGMILGDRDAISLDDVVAMQTSNRSLSALEIIPYLEDLNIADVAARSARDRLVAWDGEMTMDSPESALFNIFFAHLVAETFMDQLPERLYPRGDSFTADTVYTILQEADNPWWDDLGTPATIELRDEILMRAFEQAYAEGVQIFGEGLGAWRWGDLHAVSFENPTLGQSGIGLIESIFNRGPYPAHGGESVPQKTCWAASDPYEVVCVPAMRQVIDLGDLGNSRMIHSVGQSGHPMDPHYDDLIEIWRQLEYHPTNWERAAVEAGEFERLVLEPVN